MASSSETMRAAVYDRYGTPDELRIDEVPLPAPERGHVVVEVAATSVNLSDWECLRGTPLYARIGGLRRPACRTLGSDIAGTIARVGADVAGFVPGDEVYADNLQLKGGFAEYAVVPAAELAHKPSTMSFADASTIPQAGAIAWRGTEGLRAGQRLLINGAGGGSGMFAIQLGKRLGAHVTGVDNAHKLEAMRTLGADDVIDYRVEDWTRRGPFDLILDLVAHRSLRDWRRALAPGGSYRCVGGSMSAVLRALAVGPLVGRLSGRRIGMLLVRQGPQHFEPVADLCAAGELEIRIEQTHPLDDVPAALEHVGAGRALGKVVVTP